MKEFVITITNSRDPLRISPDKLKIGSQYDNKEQKLVFVRPKDRQEDDLILFFSTPSTDFSLRNIGKSNEFVIINALTQSRSLWLQIGFTDGDRIGRSNKIEFELEPSLPEGKAPIEPWPEPLLELTSKAIASLDYADNILSGRNLAGDEVAAVVIEGGGGAGSKGEKGDQGDPGPQGPQGEQGPKGDPGTQGSTGPQGAKGDPGEKGADGAPGPKGDKGDIGPKGDKGDKGEPGLQGPKGDAGAQGAQGPKGDTGATGAQGSKGDPGTQGPQGLKGDTGETGAKGADGAPGATGAKGEKGDPGTDGKAATIVVGQVTTVAPGTPASVVNVGTPNAALFDFKIPQGVPGSGGGTGGGGMRLLYSAEETFFTWDSYLEIPLPKPLKEYAHVKVVVSHPEFSYGSYSDLMVTVGETARKIISANLKNPWDAVWVSDYIPLSYSLMGRNPAVFTLDLYCEGLMDNYGTITYQSRAIEYISDIWYDHAYEYFIGAVPRSCGDEEALRIGISDGEITCAIRVYVEDRL